MLKIWGRANSINVQKVLWCCGELDLPYERIDAGMEYGGNGTPAYLAMNPNGLVPVLEDGDFRLWESNTIVRYLAHTSSDHDLCPSNVHVRFDAERWMDWTATTFWPSLRPLFVELVRTPLEKRNAAVVERGKALSLASARILDGQLRDRRFLAGDRFSFGDIPAAVTIHRWYALDIERPELPHLERWYDRMKERDHFRAVIMKPLS